MDSKLFFNYDKVDRAGVPFNFIIGGRGTGKTYGALDKVYNWWKYTGGAFLYTRRTEIEVESVADESYNPFKALNADKGYTVSADYTKKVSCGHFYDIDPRIAKETGQESHICGYSSAISVFGRMRGADLSDVDTWVYDEFCGEVNVKRIKGEADLFFNAYETVNRNREVAGKPPVTVYFLSNAVDIATPLLYELGLTDRIAAMQLTGQRVFTDKERGIHVEILGKLGISFEKEKSALYKLTAGTRFYQHAIDNDFAYDNMSNVEKQPLKEYNPTIQLGSLYIYSHKQTDRYYVCRSRAVCPFVYTDDATNTFRRLWGVKFYNLLMSGKCLFSDYSCKKEMLSYWE